MHLAVPAPSVLAKDSYLFFTASEVDVYNRKAVALAEFGVLAHLALLFAARDGNETFTNATAPRVSPHSGLFVGSLWSLPDKLCSLIEHLGLLSTL